MSKLTKEQKQKQRFADTVDGKDLNVQVNFICLTSEFNTLSQLFKDYKDFISGELRTVFDERINTLGDCLVKELSLAFVGRPIGSDVRTLLNSPIYPIDQELFNRLFSVYNDGIVGKMSNDFTGVSNVARIRELDDDTTALDSHIHIIAEQLAEFTEYLKTPKVVERMETLRVNYNKDMESFTLTPNGEEVKPLLNVDEFIAEEVIKLLTLAVLPKKEFELILLQIVNKNIDKIKDDANEMGIELEELKTLDTAIVRKFLMLDLAALMSLITY